MDKFERILNAIKMAIALAPIIEAAIPLPKKGKEKRDLVFSIITDVVGNLDGIRPLLETILGRLVKTSKETGAFPVAPIDDNTVMN